MNTKHQIPTSTDVLIVGAVHRYADRISRTGPRRVRVVHWWVQLAA